MNGKPGRAEIEMLAGVIRVWNGDKKYGDPYDWVATVRAMNKNEIEILGYTRPITPSIWKSIRAELMRLEIKRVFAVQYKDGRRCERWIEVK